MTTLLLILHLFVTLALIGVVLIQRSEGGGLGIGSSQGMGAFMTGRGTANLLTRATGILAALFFAISLALALLNRGTAGVGRSILETSPAAATRTAPKTPVPGKPVLGTPVPGAPATGTAVPGTAVPATPAPGAPVTGAPVTGTPVPAAPAGAPAPRSPAPPTH